MRIANRLLALALTLTPTLAWAEPAATPLQPFAPAVLAQPLAPLPANGVRCDSPASGIDSVLVGVPEVTPLNHCHAQQTCPVSGCVVSCTGHTSCTVQAASVTCDGTVVKCPSCPTPPSACLDKCCWCECKASGGFGCIRQCCIDEFP